MRILHLFPVNFLNKVSGSRYFKKNNLCKKFEGIKRMNWIQRMYVRGAIYIKNDFTKKYLAGQNPEVEVILDGRHTNGSQIIGNYLGKLQAGF